MTAMPRPSRFVRWCTIIALAFTCEPLVAHAGSSVISVGITVSDLDEAVEFYTDVLEFQPVDRREIFGDEHEHVFGVFGARVDIATIRLGDETIELMEFLAPRGRRIPPDSQSNDLWFQHVAIIVSDIDRAFERLRARGATFVSSGPQTLPDWNPDAGGISAFYFRDPDGNPLEILEFPPGKGAPKWHEPTERLFLGIDHTAIAVANTDESLRFYRDALGFAIAGTSENYGPEQERLNNVFGARLRITALRADDGLGVELLEYLAPRTGRPMPIDTRSNDLWHWQVNVALDDVAALDRVIRAASYRYVSSGVVQISGSHKHTLMVRDPDGHALKFTD